VFIRNRAKANYAALFENIFSCRNFDKQGVIYIALDGL